MELMEPVPAPVGFILCCECGTHIEPNPVNKCVTCVREKVDASEGIPKQVKIFFCRGCERYLNPPNDWVHCTLESKELLSLCLKKLKGLEKVKLVDASFIWTEPHSKRIKVKLVVHKQLEAASAFLAQTFTVEYSVDHQMCGDCHRTEAQNFWRATVQVRQKCENKKTFFYLEQLILKHNAHDKTLGIKPISDGLDFFFSTEGHARKMIDFLTSVLPCKYQHAKKLISHDIHSNIYNYKFTYSVEIVPLSKDSLICLSKKMCQQLGGISPLCLVYRVTSTIHLIDPSRAQKLNGAVFWRQPFSSICNPKQLVKYVVLDLEPILEKDRKFFPGQGPLSKKHVLADVWIVKESELGVNEAAIHTRTHLGHVLKVGDTVLGYNLEDSNINDSNFEQLDKGNVADVVLVKKFYKRSRGKRLWKLKHLAEENTALATDSRDYHEFLNDLEDDPDIRQNVNIYRDQQSQIPVDADDRTDDDDDEDRPRVTLEEMLDDLVIEDVEMAEQ